MNILREWMYEMALGIHVELVSLVAKPIYELKPGTVIWIWGWFDDRKKSGMVFLITSQGGDTPGKKHTGFVHAQRAQAKSLPTDARRSPVRGQIKKGSVLAY